MILPKTKEPIQATAPTSDQELIKSSSLPPSITAETKILPKTHLSRDPKKEVASTKLSEPVAVPPTVIETPLTTKPLKETKEPIQTTTATSDQEVIKSSPPPSMTAETMILPKTKEPIQTTAPTSDQELIKSSSPPPSIAAETKILPKVIFFPSSYDFLNKAQVLSSLAELKESIPVAATIAETAQARRTSLSGKTTDLEARLAQREKKLSFLETEFSRLSKEEEKVEAQFQFLITQKEKILANKKYVLADLEKTNDEALKDLEEWRNLESEIKQAN
ncbi:uncharacterized protein LOC131183049 [Hevea brasiliensis]|uniref:uncharacterized protein LOC131183049 n=1 Tax=Hevea brasiliensis TaxID=3981 RepID=UPI0025FEDE25|nr:uncharacterized protein LOC131183049 [Hevea brasiliensis]